MIGYIMAPGRGDTDLALAALAKHLTARGLRVCGVVQINTEREKNGACDMDVQVLSTGKILRISQDLGPQSRGCRLDISALETAVAQVAVQLAQGADVLIINKFGKHEAQGRGFRDIIAEAVMCDIPVVVGLNSLNKPAFDTFTDGAATKIGNSQAALKNWIDECLMQADPFDNVCL
ncbi:MAG: DUF2478 domain-containing protein [Rhodobacteraceae bacterium]|nr:DUF2478 domain-containing protein [Paracoccaceae bacterium]